MRQTRILLAEDNRDHQQLLLLALAADGGGVTVTVASNQEDLLEAAQSGTYDCIVLDFNIPPFTAPDLVRELEGLQDGAPRIVISSSDAQQVVIEALRTGVADFVHKEDALVGGVLWERIDRAIEAARASKRDRRASNRRMVNLQRQADTDPLTGLGNRRYLEKVLSPELRRSDRRKDTGIIVIDLDHFKRVNDTHGHSAGDAVLREVAEVIRSHASPSDTVARWGGEEFVVLRQSASLTDAWIWADDLRQAIGGAVRVGLACDRVTVSVGVDSIPTTQMCERSLERADQAMYLAKESGRDRVCTWEMVRAMDAAIVARDNTMKTPRARLIELIASLEDDLGETQRDHVGDHGRMVRLLATQVASTLGLGATETADLELAAEFHDIGKLGVPEDVLAAPRRLSAGERRLVNEHARFGAELMRTCGASEVASHAVATHHDTFEPEANPVVGLGSVICACDALVTMLSHRPYAKRKEPEQAVGELVSRRGSQFHPTVVDTITDADFQYLAAA